MKDYEQRATRVLQAVERGGVSIDRTKLDEFGLLWEVEKELRIMDKEDQEPFERIATALEALAGCVSDHNQFCTAADVTGNIDVSSY